MSVDTVVAPTVLPFVSFTSVEGKDFVLARDRIIHCETYTSPDGDFDRTKTFVNFTSPNHKSKGALHAIVDMPIEVFRDLVIRPAYEGSREVTIHEGSRDTTS